ncbi:caspase family protein [Saccharopolyspora shandongensis]|uniref:caspase family protein n=1 Tax=Saccharopolyspora shandongensis TaxID=418495 RepID=UPI0033EAA272
MGERRALLIATDTYADAAFRKLRAPEADTRAMANVLADPAIGNYSLSTLWNRPAHETNLVLEDFFAEAKRDDLLLLYLSGHGIKDEQGELYFVTADSRRERLASTAVAANFVHRQMDRCRSRSVVVWLDCCYAGAFPFGSNHRGAEDSEVLSRLSGKGRVVMTSSTALEYSFEFSSETPIDLDGEHRSVFTAAIVNGLRTGDADLDRDGLVDSGELYNYVYERVRASTPHQTPLLRADIEGTFPIATNPGGPDPSLHLPAEIRQAAQSPLPAVRAAVVHDISELARSADPLQAEAARAWLVRLCGDETRLVADAARKALAKPENSAPEDSRPDVPPDVGGTSGGEASTQPAQPRPSATRRRALVAALVVSGVALLCLVVWLVVLRPQADTTAASTEDARTQIAKAVEAVFSYDFSDIAKSERAAQDLLVGEARRQHDDQVAEIKQVGPEQQLTVSIEVKDIAVTPMPGDLADAVLSIDQRSVRTTTGEESTGSASLSVSAEKHDGKWKISNIRAP